MFCGSGPVRCLMGGPRNKWSSFFNCCVVLVVVCDTAVTSGWLWFYRAYAGLASRFLLSGTGISVVVGVLHTSDQCCQVGHD